MNPFRALFLSVSKLPPIIMLFIVLGVAVVATMYVLGLVKSEDTAGSKRASDAAPSRTKTVVIARTYIPTGSKIQSNQVSAVAIDELAVWDDADHEVATVVGRMPKRAIPIGAQIRQSDLESF
jgi:Flp pilus assembly protein CpaB